jgi:hypothetical protein
MTSLQDLITQTETALTNLESHFQREAQFMSEANDRFSKNIAAFEQYFPEVAKTVKSYQAPADFKIMVTQSGHGNFMPVGQPAALYSEDPIAQIKEQLDKNTETGYYNLVQYGFGVSSEDQRIHSRYMAKLDHNIKALRDLSLKPLRKLPEHFPTAMIFGVGLGYVVSLLLEEHEFDYLFITEPDLDVFYASLFCTDWADIIDKVEKSGNTMFLQIGLTYQEFFAAVYKVVVDVGAYSLIRCFCYQHYPSVEVNEQIKEFFDRYYEIQTGYGFYNDAITGFSHCLQNYEKDVNFFTLPPVKREHIDFPVAVIGNGPSLDEAAEILREIQDDVIIFAAGTALGSLAKMGVKADFHVLVERPKSTYDALLDCFPKEYYADLDLLAVDVIYPDVVDLYKWTGLALKGPEASTVFTQMLGIIQQNRMIPSLPFCGPLVANTALSYAMSFGFKEIYLFGVDNGYIQNKTHSELSIYNDNVNYKSIVDKGDHHILKGNFGGTVTSTNLLNLARKVMESILNMDKKIFVYNVGNGAFIEGAMPVHHEDVFISKNKLKKSAIIEEIKHKFFFKSEFHVDEELLAFKHFDEMCNHLNQIASEPFENKRQAADILKRQSRYVYAFRNSKLSHLFHMIKGSLLYFHCPMLTSLYMYDEEDATLENFAVSLKLWRDYVDAMKADFRLSWNKKCDWGMDMEFKSAAK